MNYIRFDPMNGYLYSASDDCSLRVWDVQGVSASSSDNTDNTQDMVWRDEVKHVSIQVENEQMSKPVELKCVSIHPFGGMVALGCSDNIARIWTTVTRMDEQAVSIRGFTCVACLLVCLAHFLVCLFFVFVILYSQMSIANVMSFCSHI